MSQSYQIGTDAEWAKHNADELNRSIKRKDAANNRLRLLILLLMALLGWVVYKYTRVMPIEKLWEFKLEPKHEAPAAPPPVRR